MLAKTKRRVLFWTGFVCMAAGGSILAVFGYKRVSREIYKHRLLKTSIVFEIPALGIRAPVLEGTDNETLKFAAGHFPGTGGLGTGNYCICGHNSTIYACIFNDLDGVTDGMAMYLYDNDPDRTCYTYTVSDYRIVEPSETWVLDDCGDDRITVITCTDDGRQRQVVTGLLTKNESTEETK